MSLAGVNDAALLLEHHRNPGPEPGKLLEHYPTDSEGYDAIVFDGEADGVALSERWMEVSDDLLFPVVKCR